MFTTLLIILFINGLIKNFDLFIKLFAFGFLFIAVILFLYLLITNKIHVTFRVSKVSSRFLKKIVALCSFVYAGTLIFTISQVFDTIVIASKLKDGAAKAGIFGIAAIMTSLIQAPQRAIIAASISHLSKAWKDKNMVLLQRVYQRSSINQLIFACAIFLLIWMNLSDGIITFGVKPSYLEAAWVFFILGLTKIVDMGTGVNAQIIATSTFWKFELISGVILLILMLPLTYILTIEYGIIGPAIATLISISIYNVIRIVFLWNKFRLFPFTKETIYTLLLAAGCYGICYFAFNNLDNLGGILIRSFVFILLYGSGTVYMKLSPDIKPVIETITKRLKRKNN